jgi:hypothetical protein
VRQEGPSVTGWLPLARGGTPSVTQIRIFWTWWMVFLAKPSKMTLTKIWSMLFAPSLWPGTYDKCPVSWAVVRGLAVALGEGNPG